MDTTIYKGRFDELKTAYEALVARRTARDAEEKADAAKLRELRPEFALLSKALNVKNPLAGKGRPPKEKVLEELVQIPVNAANVEYLPDEKGEIRRYSKEDFEKVLRDDSEKKAAVSSGKKK